MALEVGMRAPAFRLRDQHGAWRTLEELLSGPLLIYAYPADGTPGCTTQACDVRDRWSEFAALGVGVVGISPDDVATHDGFVREHDLPQVLLADPDHTVLEAYGAWGEKVLYGRTSVGVIRSSVLLSEDGTVLKVWRRAQARAHAERALTACRALLS
jgi:thioredoxin-dependent peroxiredoxin